jgi:hypothetical protein
MTATTAVVNGTRRHARITAAVIGPTPAHRTGRAAGCAEVDPSCATDATLFRDLSDAPRATGQPRYRQSVDVPPDQASTGASDRRSPARPHTPHQTPGDRPCPRNNLLLAHPW